MILMLMAAIIVHRNVILADNVSRRRLVLYDLKCLKLSFLQIIYLALMPALLLYFCVLNPQNNFEIDLLIITSLNFTAICSIWHRDC